MVPLKAKNTDHGPEEPLSPNIMRHRTMQQRHLNQRAMRLPSLDDADVAAGTEKPEKQELELESGGSEAIKPQHFLVLGVDISDLSPRSQFMACAGGVFGFTLLYGYLQELISVHLCSRQLGLFISMVQFSGYTFWSYVMRNFVEARRLKLYGSGHLHHPTKPAHVPLQIYLGLSLLRAVDLSMTNMAMQYINYPAKTLLKSSRVCWTMLFGTVALQRTYPRRDYFVVAFMATALTIFMHADAKSSAVFHSAGVIMLVIALICDGALTNMSEAVMNKYQVGQDQYIFSLYSIALLAIALAAALKGELLDGLSFLFQNGTYYEILNDEPPTWSSPAKISIIVVFSTLGFFGSSCAAAITKHFGALTMSITSTARKATTLFLSFAFFPNKCTVQHVVGVVIFMSSLVLKSTPSQREERIKPHTEADETPEFRRLDSGYSMV